MGVLIRVKLTSEPCCAVEVKHRVKWTVSPQSFCHVRIAPFALYVLVTDDEVDTMIWLITAV